MLYGIFSNLFRNVRETEGTMGEGGLTEHDFTHGLKMEFSRRESVDQCGCDRDHYTAFYPDGPFPCQPACLPQFVTRAQSPDCISASATVSITIEMVTPNIRISHASAAGEGSRETPRRPPESTKRFLQCLPPVHPPLNPTHIPVSPSFSINVDPLQYR